MRIDDQEADGHNVFAYIDGPWWDNVRCWDAGGWKGSGSFCDLTDNYEDNTEVDVQLCIGDWESREEIECSGYLGSVNI